MAKKNWIAGAIKHPGALSKKAKRAGQSPMEFARAHAGDSGTTGRQARLALTLQKLGGRHHSPGDATPQGSPKELHEKMVESMCDDHGCATNSPHTVGTKKSS